MGLGTGWYFQGHLDLAIKAQKLLFLVKWIYGTLDWEGVSGVRTERGGGSTFPVNCRAGSQERYKSQQPEIKAKIKSQPSHFKASISLQGLYSEDEKLASKAMQVGAEKSLGGGA